MSDAVDRRHSFLWLDLETTGLDARAGLILEWAAVLAADDGAGDMTPVDEYTGVIHVPRADAMAFCDAYVQRMHTENGLFDDCDAGGTTLAEAETFLVDLVGGPTTKGIVLAGSSVHFDLAWIRAHMPELAKCLSHRVFDVSTLKLAERSWRDPQFLIEADRVPAHRALPDVLASLAAAKAYRQRIGL